MSNATDDVLAERQRQVEAEGWTEDHDDHHTDESLALAAICYAMPSRYLETVPTYWPWAARWWKPKGRRRNLVRAAALLIAEIERLDRAAAREQQT